MNNSISKHTIINIFFRMMAYKNWLNISIILLILAQIAISQKVILVSSSLGYYNIRQVNNIVKMYQHFRKNGFNHQDILLFIGQMQACCEKNHMFGTLSFYDSDYSNIFKDIQVDYYQSQMTLQNVANSFMGYYPKFTINKRKLTFKEQEPYFIYVTGHGGDTYFKIRQKQALITEQFASIFKTIHLKQMVTKTVIFSDSCSAITPFETVQAPNFLALASSSFQQKSLSYGYDPILNQPKSDDFSFYFDQIISQKAIMKGLKSFTQWTFKHVLEYMNIDRLKTHSKLISNGISKNEKIETFMKKKQKQITYKKLNNNKNIDYFFNS